jgi:hypothetical protein
MKLTDLVEPQFVRCDTRTDTWHAVITNGDVT